jgi:hypothetical protein
VTLGVVPILVLLVLRKISKKSLKKENQNQLGFALVPFCIASTIFTVLPLPF